MWTPSRNEMGDEWRSAETSFVSGLFGALLAQTEGRGLGVGIGLLAFAVVIGVNGLWIAWWNRYALGAVLATTGILLGAAHVPTAIDAVQQLLP